MQQHTRPAWKLHRQQQTLKPAALALRATHTHTHMYTDSHAGGTGRPTQRTALPHTQHNLTACELPNHC